MLSPYVFNAFIIQIFADSVNGHFHNKSNYFFLLKHLKTLY